MSQTYLESLLAEDEKILLVAQNHGILLFKNLAADIILFAVLTGGAAYFQSLYGWIALTGFVAAILPLLDMERHLLNWRSRQYIITNRRVIQISGIVSKNVTDSSLDKVNDVKLTQSMWGRLLGYGDIEILTASEQGVNTLRFISDPIQFKKTMMDSRSQPGSVPDDTLHFTNVIKEPTIPDLIIELDALRIRGIITEEEFREKKKELLARM